MKGALPIPGLDVSRETIDKLERLTELTRKWTKRINLIAPSTADTIWDRHVRDSAQLVSHAPRDWTHWIDLGSGGGFPGLVIAIFATADQRVTLIESDIRKCTFLRNAVRELGLNTHVINARIEGAKVDAADAISARALAPLDRLVSYTYPFLTDKGVALFPKGETHNGEILSARETWDFECDVLPSITKTTARILRISRIRTRGSKP